MWHYMALCHYIIMSFLVQLPEGWLSESNKASFILPTFWHMSLAFYWQCGHLLSFIGF